MCIVSYQDTVDYFDRKNFSNVYYSPYKRRKTEKKISEITALMDFPFFIHPYPLLYIDFLYIYTRDYNIHFHHYYY